jgi:acyl carrier protein
VSREVLHGAFTVAFDLTPDVEVEKLEIGVSPSWDSVAHMALVAELEDRFGIAIEVDDLVEMGTYDEVVDVLRRYGVEV